MLRYRCRRSLSAILPCYNDCSGFLLPIASLEEEGLANSDESSWDTATTEAYGDAFGSASSGHFGTPLQSNGTSFAARGEAFWLSF
jgi:hypothetical protein